MARQLSELSLVSRREPARHHKPARIEQYDDGMVVAALMIVGTLRIKPAPDRRDDILRVFRTVQGPVLAQRGCVACHIYEEQGPEQAVVLVERWESQEALEAHLRSESYRRILGAIELAGAPPEIRFDYVSATEGMDLIERSRSPARTEESSGWTEDPLRG